MKKISIFFCSLLLSSFVFAQDSGKMEFGVTTGYGFSSVVTGAAFIADPNSGFNAGISGEYYFSDSWGIKMKILYHQKGWANGFLFDRIFGQNYITDYNLNYIVIPITANWHFGNSKNWYMDFGPYVGVLTSTKIEANDSNIKDAFSTADFGILFNIGYKIQVSNTTKIFIELGEQVGFANIFEEPNRYALNFGGTINIGALFSL